MPLKRLLLLPGLLLVLLATDLPTVWLQAQEAPQGLSERQQRRRVRQLEKELQGPFRKWLAEDVKYIISNEERKAFVELNTDEERESFIENFWIRRDPTPDSMENEFREEHYRRIAYANERFASGIPGWKSDRGRIYIAYGPADEVESHPSGGSYQRPFNEGGGSTSTYPFEVWRYRYLEGIGSDILLEFVDPTMSGEYRLTMDPMEKDALLYVPNAGNTLAEDMGLSTRADRLMGRTGFGYGSLTPSEAGLGRSRQYDQFERLQLYSMIQRPPPVKFRDLEAIVDSTIEYNTLNFTTNVTYVKVTESTSFAGVTVQVQNRDLLFKEDDGLHRATINIFGRVTTMTRKVETHFEETVSITTSPERLSAEAERASIYNKMLPLAPGKYRLELVVKDVIGETVGTARIALDVPKFDDETLSYSSVILADKIERVPTRSLGAGQFVMGASKVRPRVGEEFKSGERMGIYVEFYNLGEDDATRMPDGQITYQIAKANDPDKLLLDFTEDVQDIRGASPDQVVVEKLLPLDLDPGVYRLSLKMTDRVKEETVNPTMTFKVL
jgi:GWxTD domain-containing protein